MNDHEKKLYGTFYEEGMKTISFYNIGTRIFYISYLDHTLYIEREGLILGIEYDRSGLRYRVVDNINSYYTCDIDTVCATNVFLTKQEAQDSLCESYKNKQKTK